MVHRRADAVRRTPAIPGLEHLRDPALLLAELLGGPRQAQRLLDDRRRTGGGDIALDLSLNEVESLGDSTNIYAKLFDQLDFRIRLQGQQDFAGTDRITLYIAPQDILLFDSSGDAIVADTGKTARSH